MGPPPIASAYLTLISLRWAAAVPEKLTWCSALEGELRLDAANGWREGRDLPTGTGGFT